MGSVSGAEIRPSVRKGPRRKGPTCPRPLPWFLMDLDQATEQFMSYTGGKDLTFRLPPSRSNSSSRRPRRLHHWSPDLFVWPNVMDLSVVGFTICSCRGWCPSRPSSVPNPFDRRGEAQGNLMGHPGPDCCVTTYNRVVTVVHHWPAKRPRRWVYKPRKGGFTVIRYTPDNG